MSAELKNNNWQEFPLNNWLPTTSAATRQQRAQLLHTLRQFFWIHNVLEVETPLLSQHTVTDVHIDSFTLLSEEMPYYLQTSPEYAMKRLLAAGSGSIYQICKAFRRQEIGKQHNPEFTLLEWYRVGFNHYDLMQEVDELLQIVLTTPASDKISYRQLFLHFLNIDVFTASQRILKEALQSYSIKLQNSHNEYQRDDYLHLLLTHYIEPQLGKEKPIFIYDFPASQAALAKIRHEEFAVAERFEVYFHGIELANGFHELQDAQEQQQRFLHDLQKREQLKLPARSLDTHLLAALQHGLPNCAGVAMGIDRLLMLQNHLANIQESINFSWERA